MQISILGGGSWGSALAVHLAKKNNQIKIWEFFAEQAQKMQEERECPLLPNAKLSENIFISSNLQEVLNNSELVLMVVPSDKVESTIEKAQPFLESQPIIICSKGFASNLRLLSDAVKEKYSGEVYCLYGPTHAEEVCKGMFSGIVLAGKNPEILQPVFEDQTLQVDITTDLVGVQIASALKNVLAVFVGLLDGKGLGDNAKAYIITKGLNEIKDIGLKWGSREETFHGLAGMGDVIVTCTSKHSRNRHVGEQIGKGRKLDEVIKEMNMVAEGITAVKNAYLLEEKFGLNLPLITGIYQILFEDKSLEEVFKKL